VTTPPLTRILLADDHPMIRTALEVLLRDSEYEIVGIAGTGEATLREIERLEPDILLLDLQMPGGSGMDVLRRIRAAKAGPRARTPLRVILLTAAIDDSSLLEAKSLKVQGIVLKNSDPAFLLDCLDRVRYGRTWIDPELAERSRQLAKAPADGSRPPLSPRERQLVGFVRQGLRNRAIAELLGVTEGTVKTYLHAMFEKLSVASRTELAIRADEFLAEGLAKE
jgi:two-component system nitrate/nitrite response regulator NarP